MKIKLLDLFKRKTKFDKHKGIIFNGIDNLYSEKIERITNNSVTSKTSCNIMTTYLVGQGYGELDDLIVNEKKKITFRKLGTVISKNIAKQRGVFVHVMYNANFKIDRYNVLPYCHCRLGKKDDNKYNGKIIVYDNWDGDNGSIKKEDFEVIDVFNPLEDIVKQQVETAKGFNKYKGQILYYNLDDEFDYALGTIDTVFNDADSERQASIFKNRSLRKGFFGKTLMVTKPLAGTLADHNNDQKEFREALAERENFKKTAESFLGAENSGSLLHVELEHQEDKLEDAILVKSIPSDIDDKMFKYTEESVFKNILMAFNNIPTGLVRSDNALFSNSGEALQVMKITYQENTSLERTLIEELLDLLFENFREDIEDVQIKPLIDEVEVETEINKDE